MGWEGERGSKIELGLHHAPLPYLLNQSIFIEGKLILVVGGVELRVGRLESAFAHIEYLYPGGGRERTEAAER
jgi:hypothetical protein